MGKSSYISSFNKFPRAVLLAAAIIVSLEAAAWVILPAIEKSCMGGDLIKMDPDFLCRNFKKYATDAPRPEKYMPVRYTSWRDMGRGNPYDLIIFGNSVGDSGWAEILRSDYGFRVCNTTSGIKFRGTLPDVFINIMGNYNKINDANRSVLLFVGITGRAPDRLHYRDNVRGAIEFLLKRGNGGEWKIETPAMGIMEYAAKKLWIKIRPKVKIININGSGELFFIPDLEGLSIDYNYSPEEYSRLCAQFKEYKDIAAERGCVLAIVAFPTKAQQYEWLLVQNRQLRSASGRKNLEVLKEIAAKNNIPILDLEQKLDLIARETYLKTGRLLWSRCDTHLNELGNKYAAAIIKSFIEKIGFVARK